jgi:serine O-acetyltransferase
MSKTLVVFFRLSSLLYKFRLPIVPNMMSYFIRIIFSAWIPYNTIIGKGITFGYGGLGIVIHGRVVIGSNCHIDQHVTIGGTSKKYGVPVIGNNVYIGSGSKILGPVIIGDDVVIGANAVVINDVPSNCLVVGVPGKIIRVGIKKENYV